MRVLIACEFSGTVRDAFAVKGHYAISCDLLPTDKPGNHYQGDVLDVINDGWDLMIAHPPCTHLAVSGARHFAEKRADRIHKMAPGPNRWKERSKTYQGIANAMAEQWG